MEMLVQKMADAIDSFQKNDHRKFNAVIDSIIFSKNPRDIYLFAINFDGEARLKLAKGLVKTNMFGFVKKLAIEKPEVVDAITDEYILKGDYWHLVKIAREIPNAPIEKISEAIYKKESAKYVLNYILVCPQAQTKKMIDKVLMEGDARCLFLLARSNIVVSRDLLIKELIKRKDSEQILNFITHIQDAPVERLLDALKENNQIVFDEMLLRNIVNSNISLTNKLQAIAWFDLNFGISISLNVIKEDDIQKEPSSVCEVVTLSLKLGRNVEKILQYFELPEKLRLEVIEHWKKTGRLDLIPFIEQKVKSIRFTVPALNIE